MESPVVRRHRYAQRRIRQVTDVLLIRHNWCPHQAKDPELGEIVQWIISSWKWTQHNFYQNSNQTQNLTVIWIKTQKIHCRSDDDRWKKVEELSLLVGVVEPTIISDQSYQTHPSLRAITKPVQRQINNSIEAGRRWNHNWSCQTNSDLNGNVRSLWWQNLSRQDLSRPIGNNSIEAVRRWNQIHRFKLTAVWTETYAADSVKIHRITLGIPWRMTCANDTKINQVD